MRSSLLASLALTATLASALAPSIADACGGYADYGPKVFVVDDHNARAFVVLGAAAGTEDARWSRIAPSTYDYAMIADSEDPQYSTTFTLVGPSGSRVVSSNHHALLKQTFHRRDPQSTIEVGGDREAQFQVAVLGTQPDAKWLETTQVAPSKQVLAWVKGQGLDTAYVYVSQVPGSKIQVISAHGKDDIGLTSFVLVNGDSRGAFPGMPIGGLDIGSKRYVLLETEGMITPVQV